MEDDLDFVENGRRPNWFLKIKDNINFLIMEDDLIFVEEDLVREKMQFYPTAQAT